MFNELSSAIPDVKKSEQDPVLKENANVPNGMLSIRIFGVSNIHLSKEIAAESFGLYVNITVGAMSKSTSVQPYGKKRKVIWDEVRNFSILVPNKISNCLNRVKIAVIGFDQEMPRPKYRLMGKIELHLHKIIKKQWTMETFEMQNKETKHSGDISVEFAFAYGNFGYGFSDQLESNRSKALVEQSAFPKLDPLGTTFNKLSVLAIPRKVPHPKYIPFVTKVINLEPEMSPTYALRTINQDVFKKRPVLDQKLTRLKQLCTEYSIQSSRTKRVAFLKKLIADKESLHTLDEVEEGEDKQDEFSSNRSGGGTIGESGKLSMLTNVAFLAGAPCEMLALTCVLERLFFAVCA